MKSGFVGLFDSLFEHKHVLLQKITNSLESKNITLSCRGFCSQEFFRNVLVSLLRAFLSVFLEKPSDQSHFVNFESAKIFVNSYSFIDLLISLTDVVICFCTWFIGPFSRIRVLTEINKCTVLCSASTSYKPWTPQDHLVIILPPNTLP